MTGTLPVSNYHSSSPAYITDNSDPLITAIKSGDNAAVSRLLFDTTPPPHIIELSIVLAARAATNNQASSRKDVLLTLLTSKAVPEKIKAVVLPLVIKDDLEAKNFHEILQVVFPRFSERGKEKTFELVVYSNNSPCFDTLLKFASQETIDKVFVTVTQNFPKVVQGNCPSMVKTLCDRASQSTREQALVELVKKRPTDENTNACLETVEALCSNVSQEARNNAFIEAVKDGLNNSHAVSLLFKHSFPSQEVRKQAFTEAERIGKPTLLRRLEGIMEIAREREVGHKLARNPDLLRSHL